MKQVILIGLAILFLAGIVSCADRSQAPSVAYEWGYMRRFHQILANQTKQGRYNETKNFEFDFPKSHTTYNMSIENFEGTGENPCKIKARSVDVEIIKLNQSLESTYGMQYIAVHAFDNKVIAVTSRFEIQIFMIVEEKDEVSLQLLGTGIIKPEFLKGVTTYDKVLIQESHKGVLAHVFLPTLMISFRVPKISGESKELNLKINQHYRNRSTLHKAIYLHGNIYVACGVDGIDVYRVQKDHVYKLTEDHLESLQLVTTLNSQILNLNHPLDARDVAVDLSQHIYIADYNNGVLIYYVDKNDITLNTIVHKIPILTKSSRIAVRGDHTLVVTGHFEADIQNGKPELGKEKIYFIKELFFDIFKNDYFINREFFDREMKWGEVSMGELFTYIQGKGAHRILYQGVNKMLQPQLDHLSDFRQGIALQEMEEHPIKSIQNIKMERGDSNFIAISDQNIYWIELTEIPPSIVCLSLDESQSTSTMRIVMNSTDCTLAGDHNTEEYNLWQMCQSDFYFTYEGLSIWIDGSNSTMIASIVLIIILSLAIVLSIVFLASRKFKNQLDESGRELLNMQNKYHMLEVQFQERTNMNENNASVIQDKSTIYFSQGGDANEAK